eukprot:3937300-Rhodomonas_salina.1
MSLTGREGRRGREGERERGREWHLKEGEVRVGEEERPVEELLQSLFELRPSRCAPSECGPTPDKARAEAGDVRTRTCLRAVKGSSLGSGGDKRSTSAWM